MALSFVGILSTPPSGLQQSSLPRSSFTGSSRLNDMAFFASDKNIKSARKVAVLSCRALQRVQPGCMNREDAVFTDESRGIVCYRTESGEITCEGFDEGPYFQPPFHQEQRSINAVSSNLSRQDLNYLSEETGFLCVKEFLDGVLYEDTDEN